MGEVYLAVLDRGGFQKPVALKTMLPTLCGNRAFLERFETEAAIAARLNHANIVQIFDHGCIDGTAYLVMELVEGPDLSRLMQHNGKLPPEAVAELGLQLCRALAHAHTRKDLSGRLCPVVHGDISPSNIMVSPEGQAKLADFGIARMLDENPCGKGTLIAGKTRYMSPEQARGGELGPASDIYSLALVLVEALSGTNPVPEVPDAARALELAARGLEQPQDILAELCPPEWAQVLAPCLERNPERRVGSALELARRISERLQPGGPEELARLVEEATGGQAALQVSQKTL
ncbi:MAG: serine/threonine protein kinase, partial [Deltaproteobacteria bacterium]